MCKKAVTRIYLAGRLNHPQQLLDATENYNAQIKTFYVKVFQERDGHWFQCKTVLSRIFFC